MAAAYECIIDMTDDETFAFLISLRDADGNPPVWADLSFEYSLTGCGASMTLTEADGLVIDETEDTITIGPADPTYRLRVGQYRHGFRVTEIASNVTTQFFDGTVTVSEGNF